MTDLSFVVLYLYIILILAIFIFISPILSALVMILLPVAFVYFLPDPTIQFFSMQQFSFVGGSLSIQNIHILLLIWSALLGIIAYTEIVSWYLLREERLAPKEVKPEPKDREKSTAVPALLKSDEPSKQIKKKAEDFLLKLGKIMSGRK